MLSSPTILHATDFSDCSMPAFRLACALARDQGARLLVLHVYPRHFCRGEWGARHQEIGYCELREALHALRPPADIDIEYLLKEGHASGVITQLANERACDLIVLGTHGRSGLSRMLLGSVAETVLRVASCPVLTVKAGLGNSCPANSAAAPKKAGLLKST